MLIAYWIVAGLLALAFVLAGSMKAARPKEALATSGMTWVEDCNPGSIKLIGAAEVIGGIGLILPVALDVAPILSPIAAIALAALMVGAVVTHARRKESCTPSLVLGILSVVVAVLGFLVIR
ncbi:putative membrane protein YphA (DoxX/SURF4 family) [Microbacterium sp. W4I4]|uniref:DoxX family protein n=1 Tax=Microbacterium sp. W4I4 TaxID=3042295 RepID=UPI00278B3156|nr:DoxX family protein [Microbacterium sp. W4I4]MDQ0614727.1 putative membrane protein YphA (DoxX/SURF4 family) [Microbacterium sp. W4I4]